MKRYGAEIQCTDALISGTLAMKELDDCTPLTGIIQLGDIYWAASIGAENEGEARKTRLPLSRRLH